MEKVEEGTVFNVIGYDARLLVLALNLMVTIPSCSVCKPRVEYRDSVRMEYRDRIVHDTATFVVEKEVEKIITKDTTSHLENRWAVSDAVVSGGLLSHSLESIPQIVQVPFEVEVRDTIIVEKSSQSEIKEVEVEKPLSWWQRLRISAFWWLIAGVCFAYRKTLLKILKNLLHLR